MVNVAFAERKSAVLAPSVLDCLSSIPTINLTLGCAHNCLYCYARGYSVYPGDNKVTVYSNILEKLKKELSSKKKIPQAVYFSPSSDLFQPVPEVLDLTHKVLTFLLTRGIGVAFLTKGKIPDNTMALLISHADIVKTQIGIITADDEIRNIFEPNAAPVDIRLNQIKKLVLAGISTEARIIPVIPGIIDTSESINTLFEKLTKAGVIKAAISTLFLRPAIARNLRKNIHDSSITDSIMSFYFSKRLPVRSPKSSIIPLSLQSRKSIYGKVNKIARKYDIETSICGCMNPDIGGNCNITGTWTEQPVTTVQPNLFK